MDFLKDENLQLQLVDTKVKNEDAYAILYLKMFVYGLDKYDEIKHIFIDEMQDYSPVQMSIISYLFDCPKTILGDYNQSVDRKKVEKNFNSLSGILNNCKFINLTKSYRSTYEINNFCNQILGITEQNAISRSGEKVDKIVANKKSSVQYVTDTIRQWKERGYNSIAIITKSNKEAQELHKILDKKIPDLSLIDDNTDDYENNVCVISVFNSKGLEFDAVIAYNVSDNYKSDMDRNMLYIACTRALHQLNIVSIDTKSKLIPQ